MYRCRHFTIHELVPPEVYEARGNLAWDLLDERMLETLDLIRDDYGPIIVNNWATGGSYKYSGFRPAGCNVGAIYSMHRYGRAFDLKAPNTPLETIYSAVKDGIYSSVTTVENLEFTSVNGVAKWLHIDNRNTKKKTGGYSVWIMNP